MKIIISVSLVCICIVISLFVSELLFSYTDSKSLDKVNEVTGVTVDNELNEIMGITQDFGSDAFSVVFTEESPTLTEKLKEIAAVTEDELIDEDMTADEKYRIKLLAEQAISKFLEPLGLKEESPVNITMAKKVCMPTTYATTGFDVYQVCLEYSSAGKITAMIDRDKEMILKLTIEDYKSLLEPEKYSQRILITPIKSYYTTYELMSDRFSGNNDFGISSDTYDEYADDIPQSYEDDDFYFSKFGMICDDGSVVYYSIHITATSIEYN